MKKLIAAALLIVLLFSSAFADTEAWIFCKPGSFVNAREFPTKRSADIGRLEFGDKITVTGKTRNGFAECVGLHLEASPVWIFTGYIVYDEPEPDGRMYMASANGRTALRRWVDGPRRAWAKNGDTFRVFAVSAEWALTSKGFIKREFIEPDGDGEP